MNKPTKILICGTDSTFQYLSQQLSVMGHSTVNITANPLDIEFESFTQKPSAVFFSSNIEQPIKLIENLKKLTPAPAVFVIKSQRDYLPNKKLEEISDGFFFHPLDINLISKEITDKVNSQVKPDKISTMNHSIMHNHVSDILHKLCVTPNYNGYMYLRDAIKMSVSEPINSRIFSTRIYPKIAKNYNVSPASVERNIRTAINKGWERATISSKTEIFGLFAANMQWHPTNSEYILIIADMINRESMSYLKVVD